MTVDELHEGLSQVRSSRESRMQFANKILDDLSLFPKLMEILFWVDDEVSCRAAWVFELICRENIEVLIPHLNTFTQNLRRVHLDSAMRPVAKVCELLVLANHSKHDYYIKTALNTKHKELIIEACFDWLINDVKIATKAFAMTSLFYLGHEYDWVHPELLQILERDFPNQSAGFKARARHIIKKIKFS